MPRESAGLESEVEPALCDEAYGREAIGGTTGIGGTGGTSASTEVEDEACAEARVERLPADRELRLVKTERRSGVSDTIRRAETAKGRDVVEIELDKSLAGTGGSPEGWGAVAWVRRSFSLRIVYWISRFLCALYILSRKQEVISFRHIKRNLHVPRTPNFALPRMLVSREPRLVE